MLKLLRGAHWQRLSSVPAVLVNSASYPHARENEQRRYVVQVVYTEECTRPEKLFPCLQLLVLQPATEIRNFKN